MDPITIVLVVFFAIIAVLLIALVLLQEEQSEGIGSMFGGGGSNQIGNRKGNVLTRATGILGTLFLAICFLFALSYRTPQGLTEAERAEVTGKQEVNQFWNNTVPVTPVEPLNPTTEADAVVDPNAPATETSTTETSSTGN